MHRFYAALLCSFWVVSACGQPVHFSQVGGPKLTESFPNHGAYVVLVPPAAPADTLWVWVEHVAPGHPPDTQSARQADRVIWCYPQKFPHPNHVLKEAEGLIVIAYWDGYLWVMSKRRYDRIFRNE